MQACVACSRLNATLGNASWIPSEYLLWLTHRSIQSAMFQMSLIGKYLLAFCLNCTFRLQSKIFHYMKGHQKDNLKVSQLAKGLHSFITSFPHSVLSSYPQLMTWIASFRRAPGLAECGTPPFSSRVEATNTGDWPNLFSKFFRDMRDDFSSSIPTLSKIRGF